MIASVSTFINAAAGWSRPVEDYARLLISFPGCGHGDENGGSFGDDDNAERPHRGRSYNPMSRKEENTKALDLLAPVLGRRRGELLIDTVWNIENVTDVRAMRRLYCV